MKIVLTLLLFTINLFAHSDHSIAKHFIVIGCDGMSPDGILHSNTPYIDSLMKGGSYTFNARAVLPTSSSTNWASMLMGAGPEQHGITSNDWEKDDFVLPPVVSGPDKIFPTIFSVIKNQKSNYKTSSIYHWGGFGRLYEKSSVDYDANGQTEDETKDLAVEYIKNEKPNFLFIHFDHVDHAGHEYGHGTDKYYQSVEKADNLIGEIINAIKEAGIFDETIILVTSDHGGIGYGHGGETIEEMEIPFILYGAGVKKGNKIKHPVYTYDNAATVAFVLGIQQPYAWIGRPVTGSFIGYRAPEISNERVMLPAPIIYPKKKLYNPAGGFFIDEYPTMKIETDVEDAEIRYTTDGSEPTEQSLLYTSPIKIKKSSVVVAKLFKNNNEESYLATAFFRIANTNSKNGINFKYYETKKLVSLPVFENLIPIDSGITYQLRIDDINKRKDNFGLKYSGFIKIEKEGKYKFYTNSDDGSKLFINGNQIVDNDGDHGTLERSGSVELENGLHKIEVIYFNGGGGFWLDVLYKGPGIPKQIIPPDVLFRNK